MSTVETQVRPTPTRSLQAGYDKRLMVTAGRASIELGGKIAEKLGINLADAGLRTFANGEVYCKYEDSIRGADLFIIQSTCTNEAEGLTANDALMELMVMIDAAVGASAHRVIAVTPWYGYSRQDKKSAPREPITARLVARMLEAAGIDRLLTMDLHAGQVQGFFQKPVDHMTALPFLSQYVGDQLGDSVRPLHHLAGRRPREADAQVRPDGGARHTPCSRRSGPPSRSPRSATSSAPTRSRGARP